MARSRLVLLLVVGLPAFLALAQPSSSQDLPEPSGKFKIGHHHFEWMDSSRIDSLSTDNSVRGIVAEVWYPAENSGNTTIPYLDTMAINRAMGNKGLRSLLGPQGAALIRSTGVHTHAYEDAPFTRDLRSAPLLFG